MAQFFTDFSEYSTGSPPGDWTSVSGSPSLNIADIGGGVNALQITPSTASRIWNTVTWDDAGTDSIVEVVARFRVDSGLTVFGIGHGVAARAQASGTATHYTAAVTDTIGTTYQLSVGPSTSLDSASSGDTLYNQWRWIRIRCESTAIEMWEWLDGDTAKTNADTPDYSATDSTYTSGAAGLLFDSSSDTATMEISDFGVGMGGDEAPMSAGNTANPPKLHKLDNQFAVVIASRLGGVLE